MAKGEAALVGPVRTMMAPDESHDLGSVEPEPSAASAGRQPFRFGPMFRHRVARVSTDPMGSSR